MPTAIEYAVAQHRHDQNGSAGGPPEANLVLVHTGPPSSGPVTQVDGRLPGGLPAVLLLAVAAAVWRWRSVRAVAGTPDRAARGGV
jgi:hypothetical protein